MISIKDPPYSAIGDGIANDTQAFQQAINYAESIGGCLIFVPTGRYKITSTLNMGLIAKQSAHFYGEGQGIETPGGGSWSVSAIEWHGPEGGMMINIDGSAWGYVSCGFELLELNGRYRPGSLSSANKPNHIIYGNQVQFSRFDNVRCTGTLRHALYLTIVGGEMHENNQFNEFRNCSFYSYNPNSEVVYLDGNNQGNTCHNVFVNTVIGHAKVGLWLRDCDNNSFVQTRVFLRPEATHPTPYGVLLEDSWSRSNFFFHLQAGQVKAKTGSSAVCFGLDRSNGSPLPIVDAGANFSWTENGAGATGWWLTQYLRGVAVALSGDPNLTTTESTRNNFLIYRSDVGASLRVGVVGSPRSINLYTHGSSTPSVPVIAFGNDTINEFRLGGKRHRGANAPPTTGSSSVGDIVWNSTPVPGADVGWVCTTAGSPGTWKPFGPIGT